MSTPPPAFGVRARTVERAHVVAPVGELDLLSVEEVRAALAARPEECDVVVLDLSGLTFSDTSGMRLVIETLQELAAEHHTVRARARRPDVQRLFAMARMEDRLPFFDDVDGALAA